jgi:hypothetical protein
VACKLEVGFAAESDFAIEVKGGSLVTEAEVQVSTVVLSSVVSGSTVLGTRLELVSRFDVWNTRYFQLDLCI